MPNQARTNATSDLPKLWFIRAAAVTLCLGALAVSAPLIWAAASAGTGLITLAALGIIGAALVQCLPLALQKLENRVLQWRKAEAQTNPIEQLQNDCLRRALRLQSFRQALVTIGGQIETMREMLAERQHKDPAQVLDKQLRAVQRMDHFYQANLRRLGLAHDALEAFRDQVKRKEFEWNFAKAGQRVMAALNPHEAEDFMQALLSDEALRAVQDQFNAVFAELDVEMRSMDAPTRGYLADLALDPLEALSLHSTHHTSTPRTHP